MVRNLNPAGVVDEFLADATASYDQYLKVYQLMPSSGHLAERQQIAVDAVFRLAVYWQRFQHAWHVAAISKRPERFVGATQQRWGRELEKVWHVVKAINPTAKLDFPERPTKAQIAAVLDPDGRLLSFTDHENWVRRANNELDPGYVELVRAVAFDKEKTCVLDLLTAIRNHVAHQSDASIREINSCITRRLSNSSTGLVGEENIASFGREGRAVEALGPYVHKASGNARRVGLLYGRMEDIAESLRP